MVKTEATEAETDKDDTLRDTLIDVLARGIYGARLDLDTPAGWETLRSVGYEEVTPIADIVLSAPEISVSLTDAKSET
jgi:hypothetical protein